MRCLNQEFLKLLSWAEWCYCSAGELRFGNCRLISTTGVKQGDPLGPLLFSLVVLEALDDLGHIDGLQMQLWYLDDGTFFGTRDSLSVLLKSLLSRGPDVGLHFNRGKCEVFWPSGDQEFPSFPLEIHHLCVSSNGVELLGSPIFGSHELFDNFFKSRIDKVLDAQDRLLDLDNPQMALHLLRSCLSLSKINHLLRTVPPGSADSQLGCFDCGLCQALGNITQASILDAAWLQASLPICFGGLGLREARISSSAAFLGSCHMTCQLTDRLLHGGTVSSLQPSTLKISGEELANMCFTDLFTNSDNLMNMDAVPSGLFRKSFQGQINDLVYASFRVRKIPSPSRRMATTSRLLSTKQTVWSPTWRLEIFGSF